MEFALNCFLIEGVLHYTKLDPRNGIKISGSTNKLSRHFAEHVTCGLELLFALVYLLYFLKLMRYIYAARLGFFYQILVCLILKVFNH